MDDKWRTTQTICEFCHQPTTQWKFWVTGSKACKSCYDEIDEKFSKQHAETIRELKGEWFT